MVDQFMPHGMCYLWQPGLLWTHVISDILIGSAYFAISVMLAVLVYRSAVEHVDEARLFSRLPFWWMFLAFGMFIVACGATHFMGVWNVWRPDYWMSGGVKVVTAVASVATAVALPPLVPRCLALLRAARESEIRKEQLEVAHRELAATHAHIKELDRLKSEFFANVSHELRTPLTLILGPTDERLARPDLPPAERRLLEAVQRNARILHKHVEDLLDVTRLEAEMLELERRSLDLAELLRRTAGLFETAAAERAIDFGVESPRELTAVVDPDAIERVLINLISNAIKFTPEHGVVRVRMEERGGSAHIEVRDSGPGIPEHLRAVVFERFRQLDGGAGRAFGGTGLGLTIAKEFVGLHEGSIEVGDAPEGGAAFHVVLPLRLLGDEQAERLEESPSTTPEESLRVAPSRPVAPSRGSGPPLGKEAELADGLGVPAARTREDGGMRTPLVLVVEDNDEMGRFLLETLPEGIRGAWARDGREGLARAEELRPDVIVSDMMMPGITGEELLRALREHPDLHRTPFIGLTARVDTELKVRLLEQGAQDHITKPFHPAEVRARVANWVAVARARAVMQEELTETAEEDLEALARQVARSRQRLQVALEAADIAREREAQANRAKSNFLAVMSHELRTPLNAVMGYTELMAHGITGPVSDEQRKHLERVKSNTSHLLGMIEDILDFARGEVGDLKLSPAPLEIAPLVRELEAIVGGQAHEKGLRFEVEQDRLDATGSLVADRKRLRQILLNLLENAVKYTEEGEVRLTVAHEHGHMVFRVEDTGPGIDPRHHERIFEEFWQVDQPSTKALGGMGLGLSISRRLAREMGGDVRVTTREGGGSVFVLVLPQ